MAKKTRRTAAQRAATRRMIAANRSRRRVVRRRRNPVTAVASPVRRAARRVVRRRRNPVSLGRASSYVTLFKEALIGGAGAVAVDMAFGQINRFLPATLQRTPGQVGVGDAVKAVLTVMMGRLLSKPTRGLSMAAAKGALTVQAHGIVSQFVPSTLALGYAVPAQTVAVSNRVSPNRVAAYTAPGMTPLLSAYAGGANTPLLSGRSGVMARESVVR